jgi:hypothetical protein
VDLVLHRRRDVHRGIGDDQRLRVRRHVHHEAVADAPRSAQTRLAPHHRAHQLVGVQAALHQRQGLALAHQFHGLFRRGLAVRRVDDRVRRDIDLVLARQRLDPRARTDQDRCNEAQRRRLDRAAERTLVTRVRDGGRRGLERLADFEQPLVFFVLAFHARSEW